MQDSCAARVRTLLEKAPPTRRLALEAALLRMAIHPRQSVGQWHYLEMCASYVHKMVECAYETARVAWRQLGEAVGWWSIPFQRAEAIGATIRPLAFGQRHGQHLLITPKATLELRALAEELGVLVDTEDHLLSWRRIEPGRSGSRLVARCPFHSDHRPSMLLDPQRRRASCMACGTVHRLRADTWEVSGPLPTKNTVLSPVSGASTIGCSTWEPEPSLWLLGSLDRGMKYRSVPGGLLGVLRWAGEQAKRAKLQRMIECLEHPWSKVPDLLVALDEMEPAGRWRQVGDRWQPQRWKPRAVRYLCVDVDDCDYAPLLDDLVLEAAAKIQRWVDGRPEFTGGMSMVRTSLLGVQVVVELVTPQVPEWRRTVTATALHDDLDAAVLDSLRSHGFGGGHADHTARHVGRFVRRPGPRVSRSTRIPWIARLVHINEVQNGVETSDGQGQGSGCRDRCAGSGRIAPGDDRHHDGEPVVVAAGP